MKPRKNHAFSSFGKESLPKPLIDYTPVRNRILTRDDLLGRTAMSYLRFSTLAQHERFGGSSTDRQEEIRDEMLAEFKLTPHETWFFADKGISGGGKHRKKGQFRALCEMLGFDAQTLVDIIDTATGQPRESEIPEGIVLLIESPSRFSRERYNDYMPLLTKILERGIIILFSTMREMPWTLERLNRTQDRMFLQMMMDAAYEENKEKSRRMKKSHSRKRELLAAKQAGEKGPLPWVDPPAWITRTGTFDNPRYTIKEADKRTAIAMFQLLADSSLTYLEIADKLNAQITKYRWFGQLRNGQKLNDMRWTAPRIWQLAHDPRMIGVRKSYENMNGLSTKSRGDYTGVEAKIFPAAIQIPLWDRVHRVRPTGEYNGNGAENVVSLFPRKLWCACGARLSIHVTEREKNSENHTQHRTLVCVSVSQGGQGCKDRAQYPLSHYEPLILKAIAPVIAPHRVSEQRPKIERRIHTLQKETNDLEGIMNELTSSSDSARNRRRHIQAQIDAKEDEIKILQSSLVTAKTAKSRHEDIKQFSATDVAQAVAGDPAARKRLRRIIATLDFRIVGKKSSLMLVEDGKMPIVLPKPTKTSYRIRIKPPKPPQPGDKLRVNGELLTYVCKGIWRGKDGRSRRIRSKYDVYRKWTEERRLGDIVAYDSRSELFKGLEVYICRSIEKAVVPDGAKLRHTGRGCFEVL